jgi:hypothetical protein
MAYQRRLIVKWRNIIWRKKTAFGRSEKHQRHPASSGGATGGVRQYK